MKYRVVQAFQKYVANPPLKAAFRFGLIPPGYALIETIGRKSGQPRRNPVGDGRVDGEFWIVSEHGERAGYVRNARAHPRVRVKVRDGLRTRWLSGTAHLLPDDDPVERQRWLGARRRGARLNAAAVRRFGTNLLTVRIDLDHHETEAT
jgi:deazaflavin-dependent oxidoreductase (nitroreductase family)